MTAIGCFKQNSWSCGVNAFFLFSRNTDGVGGWSCSRASFCLGTSGGVGGGVSGARIEHVAGHSAVLVPLGKKIESNISPQRNLMKTHLIVSSISFADILLLNSSLSSYSTSFSIFTTGSALISCLFSRACVTTVDVASHFIVGDFIRLLFIASTLSDSWSFVLESIGSSFSICFKMLSAKVWVRSRWDSKAWSSWSLTSNKEEEFWG